MSDTAKETTDAPIVVAEPTPLEDLEILNRAASQYKGDRQDHVAIQNAINRLAEVISLLAQPPMAPAPSLSGKRRGRPKGSKNKKNGRASAQAPEAQA